MVERAGLADGSDPGAFGCSAAAIAVAITLAACGGLAADGRGTGDPGDVPAPSEHRLDQTLAALLEDARALPASEQRFARYLVLTPTSTDAESSDSAGDQDPEGRALAALWRARVGASKLANSLSTEPLIRVPRAIDPEQLLLRIDLRDYGWDRPVRVEQTLHADGWEAIATTARLAPELEGPHAERLQIVTGSSRPFLFANDFIATASQGELYYALLGVPERLAELRLALLGGRPDEARAQPARQYRAGFDTSGISIAPRAVERIASAADPSRGYWQAFDFEDTGRGQQIFSEPLGFEPDGTQAIFNLPNGLFGFFLATRDGERVTRSSVASVVNPAAPDFVLRSAAACFSCHNGGMVVFKDTVRERVMAESAGRAVPRLAEILDVYPEPAVMDQFMEETNRRLERSLQQAGQEPGQPDPISRVHDTELYRPLSAELAAAQLFVDRAALPDGLLPDSLEPDAYRDGYVATLCALSRTALNHPRGCR